MRQGAELTCQSNTSAGGPTTSTTARRGASKRWQCGVRFRAARQRTAFEPPGSLLRCVTCGLPRASSLLLSLWPRARASRLQPEAAPRTSSAPPRSAAPRGDASAAAPTEGWTARSRTPRRWTRLRRKRAPLWMARQTARSPTPVPRRDSARRAVARWGSDAFSTGACGIWACARWTTSVSPTATAAKGCAFRTAFHRIERRTRCVGARSRSTRSGPRCNAAGADRRWGTCTPHIIKP